MSPQEMKALIESDVITSDLYKSGRLGDCASRLSVIAPKIRRVVSAQEIELHAAKNGTLAAITMARESAETPPVIKAACITFLYWIDKGRSVDFELTEVQALIGGLVQSGLVTQDQASELLTMSYVGRTFATDDLIAAMRSE